ncbi:MAG: hypothetical protein ACKO37_09290 [Vampirovibrionales bacterium]
MMMGSFMGSGGRGVSAGQSLNPSAFWKSNVCATYFDKQAFSKAVADQRETTRTVFDLQGRQTRQDLWQQTGLTPTSPQAIKATLLAGLNIITPATSPTVNPSLPAWLIRLTGLQTQAPQSNPKSQVSKEAPTDARSGLIAQLMKQANVLGQLIQSQFGHNKAVNSALREEEEALQEEAEQSIALTENTLVQEQFKNVKQTHNG